MGGRGSGTWTRWNNKTTLEETKRVDIRFMKKQGYLKPGVTGSLQWTCRGKPNGDIRFFTYQDSLTLSFRYRHNGGDWQPVNQHITLVTTPCHYGGDRKWFLCPNCQKRVGILSGYGKHFLCRHCYGLAYGSQSEDVFSRMIRKRDKLKQRAFDESEYRKRKGMHHSTFERLQNEYWTLEMTVDRMLDAKLNSWR